MSPARTRTRPRTSSPPPPAAASGVPVPTPPPVPQSPGDTVTARIPVSDVSPRPDGGRYPAKACVGEVVPVAATVFREGHDAVAADLVVHDPDGRELPPVRLRPGTRGTDRWYGAFVPDRQGWWHFTVRGWSDPLATWRHEAEVKLPLRADVEVVCEGGARLHEQAREGLPAEVAERVDTAVAALRDHDREPVARAAAALEPSLVALLDASPLREHVSPGPTCRVWVDRPAAGFASWYEFFPRSEGADLSANPPRSGTLRTAAERLPAVAAMGFDVIYLPPVHPIGRSFRKGRNTPEFPGGHPHEVGPHDVGSPWAIGSEEGGHDAIHPDLGTLEDFDAFVAAAREVGLEVAMDLAVQASPDHPWAREHREWFTERVDGTIAYAENPPKKYQDMYPVNFDRDPEGVYAEVERLVRLWMDHGVRTFRVDNPHTKPVRFWEWLVARVHATDPDVVFLAEAFTRPAMMHTLARAGFTQSYSYFTWRTGKDELADYLREVHGEAADYMRPNFFVNTPDILHASLQHGGPAMFAVRAVLAAIGSPLWGVYAGYELFESQAVREGSEEYRDSEKYSLRPRDWDRPESETLVPLIRRLNEVRRGHPALQHLRGLTVHPTSSPHVLAFSKRTLTGGGPPPGPGSPMGDVVMAVVNLDTSTAHEATVQLQMPALGLGWHERVRAEDVLTGGVYDWGEWTWVRLDPADTPVHVVHLTRPDEPQQGRDAP